MKTASCPSCGAPVVFRSAASILAVCEYCQSTLVRHDQNLEDLGKMAALAEDRSPLQLGAEGQWKGRHFAVVGRIQLKYSQGLWNEWYLLFDDQRTAWLSEAGGEYVFSNLKWVPEALPAFDSLKVENQVLLDGTPWVVSNIEEATCIAGQGELPFTVGAGYKAPVVDLRYGERFATLDYSETPPLFFVGNAVPFAAFNWQNLREGVDPFAKPEIKAKVFRCPSCASPLSARSEAVQSVGCPSCGTVVDTRANQELAVISKAMSASRGRYIPTLPMGSKGKFDGVEFEVIGYLVQETTHLGATATWREYLLAETKDKRLDNYRWMVEYEGHWNLVQTLSRHPANSRGQNGVVYEGENYPHFATYDTTVAQVCGEFSWRVAVGDTCEVTDYYCPPKVLSREKTGKEVSWSQGCYMTGEAVLAAFNLKRSLPEPQDVYTNQPNPWQETHRKAWRLFWSFTLVALALQILFLVMGGKVLLRHQMYFSPLEAEETQVTPTFQLPRGNNHLHFTNTTTLDNNWAALHLQLVEKDTGVAYPVDREISYFHGFEDGEGWTEGRRYDQVVVRDIPKGTYYLAVDPEFSDENPAPFGDRLEVAQNKSGWSNWVMAELFLLLFPVFSCYRRSAFEARRRAHSDYAPVDGEDDE